MANYKVKIISKGKKETLMEMLVSKNLYERKAIIHGTCVKFFTDSHEFKDMWEDNFEQMPDWIRPHARLFAVSGPKFEVLYEPISKTVIIYGCDYYGWVKSVALALVADFMEDFTSEHRRNSVHGSFVDLGGRGLALIGPSGSGKTTLTYGLLTDKMSNFLTDDWFFVRLAQGKVTAYSSEKNSYIRGDLEKSWPEYYGKLMGIRKDSKGRAILDVKQFLDGDDRIKAESILMLCVLLTRNKRLPPLTKLSKDDALDFMVKNDFCNPHQLIRNKEKLRQRTTFYKELFARVPIYLLNTIETPAQSLERLKNIIAQEL